MTTRDKHNIDKDRYVITKQEFLYFIGAEFKRIKRRKRNAKINKKIKLDDTSDPE